MLTNSNLNLVLQLLEAALAVQNAKANALAALADVEEADEAAMWIAEDDRRTILLALKEIEERHNLR